MAIDIDLAELERKADMIKVLAHPMRLLIVKSLMNDGPCNVTNMQECFGIPQPTVSSHLGKLKRAGILVNKRVGTEIFYDVESDFIKKISDLIFEEIR